MKTIVKCILNYGFKIGSISFIYSIRKGKVMVSSVENLDFINGFDSIFSTASIFVGLGFIIVFSIIIFRITKGLIVFINNNNSPILEVRAKIIDKRGDVSIYHHNNGSGHISNSSSTTYYISFELNTNERLELKVPKDKYGLLICGDCGTLKYQGTRFLSFDRE